MSKGGVPGSIAVGTDRWNRFMYFLLNFALIKYINL